MTVAEQIRNKLLSRGYGSVTQQARALKTSRPNLSNIIRGRRQLSIGMAMELERHCGLSARKLLIAQLDEQIARWHANNRRLT
jgi:plasmid maintenance system antidote protein VapI